MAPDSTQGSRLAALLEAKMAEVETRLERVETRLHALRADKKPLVFLGLCLSPEEARRWLDADFRPPIRRGDLGAAIKEGYRWIGIVDGVFHQENTVSLQEIQAAVKMGAKLYGSSSMGALRAVEARPLGMVGVGRIYEWYLSGFIDSDDEVAISFDQGRGRPLSEPLVNIRATLDAAEAQGLIDVHAKRAALAVAETMRYPERSYPNIIASLEATLADEKRASLAKFFAEQAVDLKALDAVELLKRMRADYDLNRPNLASRD